jgi:hypothetical protein
MVVSDMAVLQRESVRPDSADSCGDVSAAAGPGQPYEMFGMAALGLPLTAGSMDNPPF